MPTYILTWNPNRWRDWHSLPEEARATQGGKRIRHRWSTGNTTRIQPGNRLYLLRQGVEPKGIMGTGTAITDVFQDDHWDAKRADSANFVRLELDTLLDPELDRLLDVRTFQTGPLAKVNWRVQASGMSLTPEAARALDRAWATHRHTLAFVEDDDLSMLEGGRLERWITCRRRERSLRERKLIASLRQNQGRLPCEVPHCGFDFAAVYGELGREYAHVHHLKMLSARRRPSRTPPAELVVVCANCHAMIHKGGGCRPLKGLIRKPPAPRPRHP